MQDHISIRWEEAGIRGYTDLLPSQVVTGSLNGSAIEHEVRGPRGGHSGIAKCRVIIRSRAVDLDYEAFKEFNINTGMELGVMRLMFADSKRRVLRRIEWRDAGTKQFEPAEAMVVSNAVTTTQALYEGAVQSIERRTFVRDARLRQRCIAHYGSTCTVCGFDFEKVYGAIATGFIHVHHSRPLSKRGGRHRVDPVKHLRPVCPNCHAVLHLRPGLGVSELRRMLGR